MVFIMGELGIGKELIVCVIYNFSLCCDCFFICVNCVVILVELFESEFFGYVKGVFIGVVFVWVGWFEFVDGGILFLDEVGELLLE